MKIAKKISEIASIISEIPTLKSIHRGLMYAMPLILIGSFVTFVLYLPVTGFHNIMDMFFGEHWHIVFTNIYKGTIDVISIITLISVGFSYLKDNKLIKEENINPLVPMLIIVACYFCISRFSDEVVITKKLSSATGLLQSVLISLVSAKLFLWFYKFKKLHLSLFTNDAEMVLSQTLSVLLPSFFTILIVCICKVIIVGLGFDVFFLNIYNEITKIAYNGNMFISAIIFDLLANILWFFGFHGTNMLENFNQDIFCKASEINGSLHSLNMPPTQIFTKQFFDVFVFIGGCGSTLSLIIILICKANKNALNSLAKFSIIPGLFNINEIIIYGLPVILNPFFIMPFVFTPVILTLTSWFAMYIGAVPMTVNNVDWTTPIVLGGYIATESIAGSILQLINLFIGCLVYYPFVKMFEQHKINTKMKLFEEMVYAIDYIREEKQALVATRFDEVGYFARSFIKDIETSIKTGKNPMTIEYQPKVNYEDKVVGCEALLRWNHYKYGKVPPTVVVSLAEDGGLANELGDWILEQSLKQKALWNKDGLNDIKVSINLSASQIKNEHLPTIINNYLNKYNIKPNEIELELTENMAIEKSSKIITILSKLRGQGVDIAIDDFGMGHSSLLYIKDFFINVVKLDGSLVKDIVNNISSQVIVASITSLCAMLDLKIVAEFVEVEAQKEKLHDLNCNVYQGYLYSPSLAPNEFIKYVEKMNS